MAKGKGAGHLVGIAAVGAVGYFAYKSGAFASLKKLLAGKPGSNNPVNVPYAFAFNALNLSQADALKTKVEGSLAAATKLPEIPSVLTTPLVVLAPASADSASSGWSQDSGNFVI